MNDVQSSKKNEMLLTVLKYKVSPISYGPPVVILAERGWGVADNCTSRKCSHELNDKIISKRVKAAISFLSLVDTG